MIKKIIPLFLITSCSYISYSQLPELINQAVRGVDDIEITEDFISLQPYSFAKLRMGKQIIAITVLSKIDNDVFIWISQDKEKIYTKHGKIIQTFGLRNDIKIEDTTNIIKWSQRQDERILLSVTNPSAMITQDLTVQLVEEKQSANSTIYLEHFKTEKLKWSGTNKFEVDLNQRIISAEQYIHPDLPKVEMFFYYK